MHRQLVAVLDRADHGIDVGEIDPGIDALRVQVDRQRDEVHVAGALAVAEQATFDAIGARHERQLGRGHGRAAVVVGMDAQHHALPAANVAAEPFDLVGIDVGGRHLHGGGQVQDHRPLPCRLPNVHDRLADLHRKVELGAGEALGRILNRKSVFVASASRRTLRAAWTARAVIPVRSIRTRPAAGAWRWSCRGARSRASHRGAPRRCARSAAPGPA